MPDRDARVVVLDASAAVDLVAKRPAAEFMHRRLRGVAMHAPDHLEAECLSALGRLYRGDRLTSDQVGKALSDLTRAPIVRHALPDLLLAAWDLRANLRVADALYVALADQLDVPLVTTDARLARATSRAELIQP